MKFSQVLYSAILCGLCLPALSVFAVSPVHSAASVYGREARDIGPASPWVNMPAGARVTYIGIHGGTVPVSLLTDKDGTSMVTFVGQTGNDFLRILLRSDNGEKLPDTSVEPAAQLADPQALPPMPDGPAQGPLHAAMMPASNATVLQAETAVGNIPVIYVTGKGFARMDLPVTQWLPFGLSEKPLQLEGQVVKPIGVTKIKKQRRFSLPKSLKKPT
ncbi:MAG: hypothetical protein RRY29_06820 [Desulfovibrionaceae bacterium]